ncbi:hypothetical protein C8R48DRAFT_547524, partial [Suillus tomentosus]
SEQSASAAKFICICSKHNFGRPHTILRTTWYEHLQQAETTEEKTRMQAARHGTNEAAPSATRRAAIAQELAKRSREISDAKRVRHRKRARNDQPISDEREPLPPQDDQPIEDDRIVPPAPDDQPIPDEHEPLPPQDDLAHQYEIDFERRRKPNVDDAMEFILLLKNASLDDPISKLLYDALDRLRNPPQGPIDIDRPGIRHSISMYLALEHASQDAYNRIQRSTMRNFAQGNEDILSFYAVEKLISKYTGVESIDHDMCPNTCLAYTGPYAHLDNCPICDASRWDQARLRSTNGRVKVAAQKFSTIPLGPQLQSLYRHPDSARN